jgi:hypothetical protein
VLHTWTSTDYPNAKSSAAFANLVVLGWDSAGPIVVVGSNLGEPANNSVRVPIRNRDFAGGFVARLGGDGTPGQPIALGGYTPAQVSPTGQVTCFKSTPASMTLTVVRATGGTEVRPSDFALLKVGPYDFQAPTVAVGPNGLLAVSGQGSFGPAAKAGAWRGPNGAGGALPALFYPEGWVDSQTIFGRNGNPFMSSGADEAALVRLGTVQPTLENLGFRGDFVGMLG